MTTLKKVKKHLKRMQPYTCECKRSDCFEHKFFYEDVPWLIKEVKRLQQHSIEVHVPALGITFPAVEGAVGYEAHPNTGIIGYMEKPPDPLDEMTKDATVGIKWALKSRPQ